MMTEEQIAMWRAQLATLDAAIAQGALRVKFNDREVTYRSHDDLMKARAFILAQIAALSDAPRLRRARVVRFATSDGLA